MKQENDVVRKFFEDYEKSLESKDPEFIAARYADSFMFAGPQGSQAVKKEDFLKVLPKRQSLFQSIGLTSSTIRSLEESRLDDHYLLVKVNWDLRFENEGKQPIVAETRATYILRQEEASLRIVFQLDHQDLLKRVQELGLSPPRE